LVILDNGGHFGDRPLPGSEAGTDIGSETTCAEELPKSSTAPDLGKSPKESGIPKSGSSHL